MLVPVFFGFLPILTNGYLAYQAFVDDPLLYGLTRFDCYVTLTAAFAASLASFIAFVWHGLGPTRTLLTIGAQSIILIFVFAGIYRGHGLMAGNDFQAMLEQPLDALYFSIVTWTTLGYGDLVPPHDIRLVAAIESLVGNLSFGTAVGLGTYLLCKERLTVR